MNSAVLGLITYLAVMTVFKDIDHMLRAFIGPKLEKSLGRQLTEWDWQIYCKEVDKKAEFEAQQEIHRARRARMNDLKIIHDFVWKNNH